MPAVTQILSRIEAGDPSAAEQLLPLLYDELRKLAADRLAQEKPGQTLQPTALVHEAYVRLDRLAELSDYIATGESGMQTFDQHLVKMYRENLISGTEALRQATNAGQLSMAMRGITEVGAGHATA